MSRPVTVVVGVGPGNGAAFARRFAREGHALALVARSADTGAALAAELAGARAYACDVGDPDAVARTFAAIRAELGDPAVVIYNAGSGVWGHALEITLDDFESAWRTNALGLLAIAREVAPAMQAAKRGAIIVVGATASRRGGARFAAFAPAKAAQKSLAESMARHLGPGGIHVALLILDGVVATPRTVAARRDTPAEAMIAPEAIAESAWQLVQQPRSAWTFELDLRPSAESW